MLQYKYREYSNCKELKGMRVTSIRLNKELYEKLKTEAQEQNRSISNLISNILIKALMEV